MDINFLNKLMDEAGKISMRYFSTCNSGEGKNNLDIKIKNDKSPVTIADKMVEQKLREIIEEKYPNHNIIGEEFEDKKIKHISQCSETAHIYTWVIDPIDGTKAFIEGRDTFANMAVLLKNEKPILSAVSFPAMRQRYMAINKIAYLNGKKILAKPSTDNNFKLAFTDKSMFTKDEYKCVQRIEKLTEQDTMMKTDAYSYCRLASGDKIVIVEADLKLYDFLPLVPILKASGGMIVDWREQELTPISKGRVVAMAKGMGRKQTIMAILKTITP